MNRYPPLKAIIAFDAAMRTSSFSLAAAELFVTPGAVGQQIQKLEEWLGVSLFVRQVRQVQPTEAALGYWKRIQPALAQIVDASNKLRDSRSMAVSLSMPPGFAAKWFTSRMASLLREGVVQRKPEVTLSGEVECDEVYVVAGHKGHPEAVRKKGERGGDGG